MIASTKELQKNYKNSVFSSLTQFQFVESLLKDCIIISYKIIKLSTKDILDFSCTEKEIDRKVLHALCTIYKKLCKNKDLVFRIKKAAKHRNKIAHEACYQNWKDNIAGIDDNELHRKGLEIFDHGTEATELVSALLRENKRLKEQLTKCSTRTP